MLTVAIVERTSDQSAAAHFSGLYNIKTLAARALYRYHDYDTLLYSVSRTT